MKRDIRSKLHMSFWGAAIILLFLLMSLNFYSQSCARSEQVNGVKYPIAIDALPKQMIVELPNLADDAVQLTFVLIDSGTFIMGSPLDEAGRSENDWAQHRVTISRPFYLGKFEVTQAQWEAVMETNPSYFKGKPNHPVEKITWRACQKFINKLNALEQATFRLPTEAEWEYACRAGSTTRFYFGDASDWSGELLCPIADEHMWWAGNNEPEGTKPVGLKKPNAWGLYDMHGNVHEWCADRWQLPYDRGAQIDPQGPKRGSRFLLFFTNRTAKGGCFRHGGLNHCRSAYRFKEQASDFYYGLGFRLVREVESN